MGKSCSVVTVPETVSSDVESDNLSNELRTLAPALEAAYDGNDSEYVYILIYYVHV